MYPFVSLSSAFGSYLFRICFKCFFEEKWKRFTLNRQLKAVSARQIGCSWEKVSCLLENFSSVRFFFCNCQKFDQSRSAKRSSSSRTFFWVCSIALDSSRECRLPSFNLLQPGKADDNGVHTALVPKPKLRDRGIKCQ